MKRLLICAAALLLSAEVAAVPNMPMVCKIAAVNAVCPGEVWTTAPGANGKYVAVAGKGVIDWAQTAATDLVRVCPSDVAPGSACPVARISLAKSLAASAAEALWNVKFSWDAPTTDVNGTPLPPGEITGYVLSYHDRIGGSVVNITLGNVLSYSTKLPRKAVCARVTAVGKSGENTTSENCEEPPPLTGAITPSAPTNFKITFTP